jgi:hypothetical protein
MTWFLLSVLAFSTIAALGLVAITSDEGPGGFSAA